MKPKDSPSTQEKTLKDFPLKHLTKAVKDAVEVIGNEYNKKQEIKKYLELSRLTNIINNSPTLRDVFKVDKDGFIVVKNASESKLLQGHFPGLTIVPGVVLRQLYEEISGNKYDNKNVKFIKGVNPGTRLKIVENGIITEDGDVVFEYNELNDDKEGFKDIERKENGNYLIVDNSGDFVLHDGDMKLFDLVSVIKKNENEKLSVGDIIHGEMYLSRHRYNKGIFDDNGLLNPTFFDEIAAQVASVGYSFFENTGLTKDDDKFKLLTYKEVSQRNYEVDLKDNYEVRVEIEILELSKRELKARYIVKSGNGQLIQTGEFSGGIISKALLKKCMK